MDAIFTRADASATPRPRGWLPDLLQRWGEFLEWHGMIHFPSGGCCIALLLALLAAPLPAGAADAAPLRIGVLADMDGPYGDAAGPHDLHQVPRAIPGPRAFQPLADGNRRPARASG